jgi:hypothetical protein
LFHEASSAALPSSGCAVADDNNDLETENRSTTNNAPFAGVFSPDEAEIVAVVRLHASRRKMKAAASLSSQAARPTPTSKREKVVWSDEVEASEKKREIQTWRTPMSDDVLHRIQKAGDNTTSHVTSNSIVLGAHVHTSAHVQPTNQPSSASPTNTSTYFHQQPLQSAIRDSRLVVPTFELVLARWFPRLSCIWPKLSLK